jgi:hypothetical protein
MITTWKVAVLAALTSVSIASPALAQSAGMAADRARAGYPSPLWERLLCVRPWENGFARGWAC